MVVPCREDGGVCTAKGAGGGEGNSALGRPRRGGLRVYRADRLKQTGTEKTVRMAGLHVRAIFEKRERGAVEGIQRWAAPD